MAIREGRWDCPSCGSTAIYGRHVGCPSCGKPRPGGVRFYLTDDAPALVDPERLAEARAGADWVCEHCGASNRATHGDCEGCGAPRGSSPTQPVTDYGVGEVPRSGAAARPKTLSGKVDGGKKFGCGGCGCLVVIVGILMVALGAILLALNPPVGGEDLEPTVVASRWWTREVMLEERTVVPGEGWELPDSALNVRRERRIRSYDRVIDHYEPVTRQVAHHNQVSDGTETRTRQVSERVQTGTRTYVCGHRDMGNGYFEDIECSEPEYETVTRTESYEEPRYRTETTYETVTENEPVYRRVPVRAMHYTYRIPKWVPSRTLRGEGRNYDEPAWPEFKLRQREREARRTQQYVVVLRGTRGGAAHLARLSHGRWERYTPGMRVAVRVGRDGTEPVVFPPDSLAACRRWHAGRGDPPPDSLGCSPRPAR